MRPIFLALALCAAGSAISFAQQPSSAAPPGHPARVTDKKSEKATDVLISGFAGRRLSMNAGGGTATLPVETVSAVEFDLPAPVVQASEAYRKGDVEKALGLYAALDPLRAFASLPKCNVSEEFLNYADSYRQARKYAQAEALLGSLDFGDSPDCALRATLIRAFILCDKNQIAGAEELMKDFPRTAKEDFNFPLDRIVRTRIFLAKKNYQEAALEIGEAVAVTRVESPVYPECLYLAAACYEKMGEVLAEQSKKTDRPESDKIIDNSMDYAGISESVRQELCLLFSKNYWAKQKPASVKELLAQAASIPLSEGGSAPVAEGGRGDAEAPSPTEAKPVWDNFISKPETQNENEEPSNP